MGRLLDEDDVVDWLLKRTEMYDATGHFVDENVVKKNIESQIAKIPSAQPELAQNLHNACVDTVSRQAALDVIDAVFPVDPMKSEYAQGIACGAALAKTYVEQLPSEQPERMKGKWKTALLDHETFGVRPKVLYCSECNQCIAYPTRYCPNCGADMRGEQE